MTPERYTQLTASQHNAFLNLTIASSPENMSAAGEKSREMQTRMHNDLARQWKALETEVGFPVSQDDVWQREVTPKRETTPPAPRRPAMR